MMADPSSISSKNEGDCNQMITTCLYGIARQCGQTVLDSVIVIGQNVLRVTARTVLEWTVNPNLSPNECSRIVLCSFVNFCTNIIQQFP
jgi:hypothetical protein